MAAEQTPETTSALPQNVEAEAALLGGLMIHNPAIDHVADRLESAHFFEPLHGRIYDVLLREHSFGRVATPITLRPYFVDDEAMKEIGGPAYLAQLTGSGAALIGFRDFADQIRELAQLRALIGIGRSLAERAANTAEERTFAELAAETEAEIHLVSGEAQDGVVEVTAAEAMRLAIEPEHSDPGVLTGIEGFDRMVGAIKSKQMVVVAGRPGMGKTALATSIARGVTKALLEDDEDAPIERVAVLIISKEMSAQEIGERLCADLSFNGHSGINYDDIVAQRLTVEQSRTLARIASRIENLPLQIIDTPAMTSARVDATIRRWKRRFAARGFKRMLVVVDYLQLIQTNQREKDPYTRVSMVSTALKATAKRNDVPIVALAQLSRAVEQREDKRPHLSDLRDSGQIEQDADTVVFLFRHEYYLRTAEPPESDDPKKAEERAKWERALELCDGQIEFIVAKRRGGRTGTGRGRWWGGFQAVR